MTLLDVIQFCLQKGGKAFEGWPIRRVADMLTWHARKKTLLVLEDEGRVCGVLYFSRASERVPEGAILGLTWKPDDPHGRVIYVGAIVGDARKAFQALVTALVERVPDWRETEIWAHRRGRLVRYPVRFFKRFILHHHEQA